MHAFLSFMGFFFFFFFFLNKLFFKKKKKKNFQEYRHSGPDLGPKLFAKVISRRQKSQIVGTELKPLV